MSPALDLKKQISTYSAKRGVMSLVTVPPLQYLMIDGHGDPNTASSYADALATLFPVAYWLKFHSKKELGHDYTVMPLEALWSADSMDAFTTARDKSMWSWTVLNLVPDHLGPEHVELAREAVAAKGKAPSLDALRLERYDEGLAVQTLHVGSYDDEAPVLEAMHRDAIVGESLVMTGRHHEIYLNDARRAAPEKLRTILRQPVGPA